MSTKGGTVYSDGIWVGYGSLVYFEDESNSTPYPNNLITNNLTGLEVGDGSFVSAGLVTQWQASCTNNSFHNNNYYNILCVNYSLIAAEGDYWGNTNHEYHSFADETSEIDYGYDLTTDPWGTQNIATVKPSYIPNSGNHINKSMESDSSSTSNLSAGVLLEKQGRINDAINFYKDLITNDKYVKISLSQLARIKEKYSKNELADYFESLLSNQRYYPIVNKLLGNASLRNNQFDNAISAYNNVIRTDSSGYDGISARFEKLFAFLHIKKDPTTAAQILSDIKAFNSKDREVNMRIKIAENLINGGHNTINKSTKLAGDNIPNTYTLYQNYPNPFNPATTIKYQIPKPGLVTLKVFDILGREVATLVNENKVEGIYDFTFDASRFASGVYIYQLRANDYVSSKKMLLLK